MPHPHPPTNDPTSSSCRYQPIPRGKPHLRDDNKLAPRWKGPFVVRKVPNRYQVTYEDGLVWRTIYVNHAKPAKLPATGFPAPIPTPEPPRPALGYLPRSMQRPLPRQQPPPPPQSATPAEVSPAPAAASPAATPPTSWRSTRVPANRNSGPRTA